MQDIPGGWPAGEKGRIRQLDKRKGQVIVLQSVGKALGMQEA